MSAADGDPSLRGPRGARAEPVGDDELEGLFAPFLGHPGVLIAVSGGPDSTALAVLAARWRRARGEGPMLGLVTVDHGLRPGSAREAEAVRALADAIGLSHRTLHWRGAKPTTGVQEAARAARYRLLTAEAKARGSGAIALGHTLDDQAETVLFRLSRGSGLSGLAAMRPASRRDGVALLRPLLGLPKARLIATLRAAGVPFVEDPSNGDTRYARARLRVLAPLLADEGLSAARLALFARRMARADEALERATDQAGARIGLAPWQAGAPVRLDLAGFGELPKEIGLRLLARAIDQNGREGPAELAKLEAMLEQIYARLKGEPSPFRRTLAGALVAIRRGELCVSPAPERRKGPASR
ncbi:tRNA lysidine(34) synthetase TilS [Xanthobacter pseudotagetidis]|uniref:tRNA lysidine(34) synthetase TilS n=1 Tax=Xanthobacter pseudotagetidis TaxID=3119911 RepID=UPI0037293C7B